MTLKLTITGNRLTAINQDGGFTVSRPVDAPMRKLMDGACEAYFRARVLRTGVVILGKRKKEW